MSGEWVICKQCALKFRVREDTCPRCETPRDETQVRWGSDSGPGAPRPRSAGSIAAPIAVLGLALAGALAWFAPPGFFNVNTSLAQKISRVCEAGANRDCACVGQKTLALMSPEQKTAELDTPDARDLMQTASQLCLKDRLVAKCRDARQGNEFQCICIVDGAVNAFTADELETLFNALGEGAAPPRYSRVRASCLPVK